MRCNAPAPSSVACAPCPAYSPHLLLGRRLSLDEARDLPAQAVHLELVVAVNAAQALPQLGRLGGLRSAGGLHASALLLQSSLSGGGGLCLGTLLCGLRRRRSLAPHSLGSFGSQLCYPSLKLSH